MSEAQTLTGEGCEPSAVATAPLYLRLIAYAADVLASSITVGVWMASIEQGFRTLKRMGWQWHRSRRVDPDRVDRHWLVLAVATLWVLAHGTRVEEAYLRGLAPGRVRTPPLQPATVSRPRPLSVFQLGLARVQRLLHRGYGWARVWLQPLPGPDPPGELRWMDPPGLEQTIAH